MTIFHVIKYPVPDWSDLAADSQVPECICTKFFNEVTEIYDSWCEGSDSVESLNTSLTELYIHLLTEYEGPA